MRFRFQFRRYRLPFRAAVRTAHGRWAEREGVIVKLENVSEGEAGAVGFGEAAPIPWFGTETIDEIEDACRRVDEWVEEAALQAVPAKLGCLRNALAAAQADCGESPANAIGEGRLGGNQSGALGVAALLPAGRGALAQIPAKAETGFRVFKWKVGIGDIADELVLLDDVCAALPSGGRLRLDANGAWDRRRAERWLERCAERPIEFVEQPCLAETLHDAPQQRRTDDILLGLAADYPTPIALDESLIGDGDVERWIGAGWPGVFVLKPSLLGNVTDVMARLRKAKADVVFSSALETAVGARSALRVAFAWNGEAIVAAAKTPAPSKAGHVRALGFGVWPLFADSQFDGPAGVAFLRSDDIARVNAEAVWNALR